MEVTEDEVSDLEVNLMELEGDVNFLFDEQVIQDERLFSLEQDSDVIDEEIESNLTFNTISSAAWFLLLTHFVFFVSFYSFRIILSYHYRSTGLNSGIRFPSNSFGRERRG